MPNYTVELTRLEALTIKRALLVLSQMRFQQNQTAKETKAVSLRLVDQFTKMLAEN